MYDTKLLPESIGLGKEKKMPLSRSWLLSVLLVLVQFIHVYANTSGVGENTICLDGLSGVDNTSCWSEGCLQPCKSLMFALFGAQGKDSTTIQIYDGTYSLSQNSSATDFYGITDLAIVGMNHHAFINCTGQVGGISFFNCTRINITNVTISGCGALRNSTSKNFAASNFSFLEFNVTLYFLMCKNVTLTSVTIANSIGTGVVMYATVGEITIQLCAFLSNKAVASGGGLYIEFPYCFPGNNSCLYSTDSIPLEFAESSSYYIYSSTFQGNAAYSLNENDAYILPQKYNHLAFGRGGGLSVFFKGHSHDNTVKVSHCNFSNNMALWGGGILAEHQDFSSNNALIVDHCRFLENVCPFSSISNANGTGGGGVRLGYIFFDDTRCRNNTFLFRHTTFIRNGAYYGGGLSFYAPLEDSIRATNTLEFHNCSWFSNTGRLGSAIDLSLWHPVVSGSAVTSVFDNCEFHNNYYIQPLNLDQYVGIGALYSDNIPVSFTGETVFHNNSHSAVAAVATYLSFDANSYTMFLANSGRIGGAIALMGNAFIITSYNSNLSFVNNSADLKGGAIYGEFVGEHDLLSSRNCFIRYRSISFTSTQWKSYFYFRNNTVKTAALPNAIYATTILTCVWGGSYGNSTVNNLSDVFNWTNWQYDDANTTNEINTSPLLLKATSNSSLFLIIPGQRSTLPIKALDDNSRNVTSSLVMTIQSLNSSSVAISDYTQYVSDNSIIVYGNNSLNTTATLVLQTTDPKVIYTELNVTLQPCPLGMVISQDNPNTLQCVCGKSFGGRIKCAGFSSTILRGQWMGWVESQFVVGDCAYCAGIDSMTISIVLPDSKKSLDDSLCRSVNRTGTLCGRCMPPYGLTADLVCTDCTLQSPPIRVIIYIVTQFVPVTFFFLILLLFNVSITSGPINSFVFFAQMITTACDITAEGSIPISPQLNVAINTIYDVWNLNFLTRVLPNTCLDEHMSPLLVQSLSYINAVYPLFLVGAFFLILSLYDRGCNLVLCMCRPVHIFFVRFKRIWNLKGSAINAVAAFFLLSYFKFTSVSLRLLYPVYLRNDDGIIIRTVWYYDGNVCYLDSNHRPYFALGVLMMGTFVAIPPIILMLPSVFRAISKLSDVAVCTSLQNSKMEQFLNIFYGCYQDGTERRNVKGCDLRWFSGFYFVLRLVFLLIHAFSSTIASYPLQQIICMISILMLVLLRPYKNFFFNIIDIVFFANLVIITSLTMYNYYVVMALQQNPSTVIMSIQGILLLWPAIYVALLALYILRHQHWCATKIRLCIRLEEEEEEDDITDLIQ